MNFLPLYRGAAGVTATVATLVLLIVLFIASENRKKSVKEKKTVEELSRGVTQSLTKVLQWDQGQFKRHEETVLKAVQRALEKKNNPKAIVMALDVLSHENCPRALMHKSVEQVVPLLQSEYNLVKYLAIYALYSNLLYANHYLKYIMKVDQEGREWPEENPFSPITDRVFRYALRFGSVFKELNKNFEKKLALAKQADDESWVEWAMEWVWDDFDLEDDSLDFRVHLCRRLLDDEKVGNWWLQLTETLINRHQNAPWLKTTLKKTDRTHDHCRKERQATCPSVTRWRSSDYIECGLTILG